MKKEIKMLMDAKRNVYITDGEKEYSFWPLGLGIPVSFIIETKEEKAEKDRKEKEREREERFKYAKRRYEEENIPWYKKIFN